MSADSAGQAAAANGGTEGAGRLRRRLLMALPLVVLAGGGVAFYEMLQGMRTGSFDPRGIPSPLVGHPMPDFDLPGLPPSAGFSSADVRAAAGHAPVLVNFFASWCVPCVVEAPVLMGLKQRGLPIWGIAYKDKPEASASFLARRGDPYFRVAQDAPGRVAIDFGLYGVPETYFIDRKGIVRWRWAGPLTDEVVGEQLDRLLKTYA